MNAKAKSKLLANFPPGTEVYSVSGDTAYIVESWEKDLSGLTCVWTYKTSGYRYKEYDGKPAGPYKDEERTDRVFFDLKALFENRLIRRDQPEKIRMAQRVAFGSAWDDPE